MRSFIVSFSAFVAALSLVMATEDPCSQMCSNVSGCAGSKYGSYCKSWVTPSVCFGLIKKSDGSICFEPADSNCVGEPLACSIQPTIVPATTTQHPTTAHRSTTTTTTAAAATTTTVAAATTTTAAAATTTTTTAAAATTTTAAAATTTTAAAAMTTTAAAATTTTAAAAMTTTAAAATTTTAAAATTTTAAAATTTTAAVETATTASTTTEPVTTTTVETTTTEATTTIKVTTTTQTVGLNGNYCGNLYGQDFSVDFESGRATLSVLGQTAGCDYQVDGTDIIFSNYDDVLQKLMDMFHIKKIQGTIESPTEIHIKAGLLINTTLTQC
ncbi:Facilitator of iron transport 3 precursor, putative [Perkinsus marinus ATCC 50983]|uniref:Facilitator of iron transport 3, putative n=1 Tax=Perkinsus marinus (strain ATCC 50983 / TXsc) TaxID=423536 RepID=C5LQI8_PERM5|nr:Facilitator of iron transport 3 precursor, putative [Perkinsus marinus ATCC 50983]EER01034.1 Facilitator of iron transport 3 precursor, putative [Perkinsus marinus ATCC 50983]|eukprot:XP_002768316.1 Facilitator of iron transport 3 precursor, putative [Perkinsus marinus ATCC 50983]